VVREYVGTGTVGQFAARMDAIDREKRETERRTFRVEVEELAILDARVTALNELADLMARATLTVAGYRQHNRGEWRRTRGQANHSG
jgi:hypothetical protein